MLKPEQLSPVGLILIAPGLYGKTYWLQQALEWHRAQGLVILNPHQQEFETVEAYFANLAEICQQAGLPFERDPYHWQKALADTSCVLLLDQWDSYATHTEIQSFWQIVLKSAPANWVLLLAARQMPDLPLLDWVSRGAGLYDASQLAWTQTELERALQSHELSFGDADARFLAEAKGWPMACLLYLRLRQGELSESLYPSLLQSACQSYFPAGIVISKLWQSATQKQLKTIGMSPRHWPALILNCLEPLCLQDPHYWIHRAMQADLKPFQTKILLERALSLNAVQSTEHPQQSVLSADTSVHILTRLAHVASQLGQGNLLDLCLEQARPFVKAAYINNQAAFLYLQANRYRQVCRYAEAHHCLDDLLAIPAQTSTVMNFHLRARVLRGLIAYQQGDYIQTRQAYSEALYLAQVDQHALMQLELEIMLRFLDVYLGQQASAHEDSSQSQDLFQKVLALPLADQPLMLLNLLFIELLGEHLDLTVGQQILQQVQHCEQELAWPFLNPLLADLKARLWRFHQDLEQAQGCHQQALSQLELTSFEWLYASLNLALTLMRARQTDPARSLLKSICQRAHETGTLGILREAQAALSALEPASELMPSEPAVKVSPIVQAVRERTVPLRIQSFGSFQVQIEGQQIERWPRKRARHVLLKLLLNPHGVHRETLADWLSSQDEIENVMRNLDVHIHALRKVLEPDRQGKQASRYILFHDAIYGFNWQCDYHWDAEDFQSKYSQWLSLREQDSEAALQLVQAALALYQGPFLPELDFADDWLAERESYSRKATDLIDWLLNLLFVSGRFEQAEHYAETLLKWDPVSESGYMWLLKLVSQHQDRLRLERLGERIESVYDKELGIAPSKKLLQFYQQQINLIG